MAGNLIEEHNRQHTGIVQAIGIQPGDYVCLRSWWHDRWSEVICVFDDAITIGKEERYVFMYEVAKVHRQNDPWDFCEARIVENADGVLKPLPDKFLYQGTIRVEPWIWNYCNKNVLPKQEKTLTPFLELHGINDTGIAWHQASGVIDQLQTKRIRGWYPICKMVPEQKFEHTIEVQER